MTEWLMLALLGFVTGTLGVMVGTGGGLLLVPLLLLFFDMDPGVIAGTSLALVAVNGTASTYAYLKFKFVDVRSGNLFAIASIPGTIIGPLLVANIAGSAFRIMFGLMLVALGVHILVKPLLPKRLKQSTDQPRYPGMMTQRKIVTTRRQTFEYQFNEVFATASSVVIGFISAFIGGGFIRTPLLVSNFNFPVRVAIATSVYALLFTSIAGSLVHGVLGHIEWYPTFVWAGLGSLFGGQIGARLAVRLQGSVLMRILVVLLIVMGGRVMWQGIAG